MQLLKVSARGLDEERTLLSLRLVEPKHKPFCSYGVMPAAGEQDSKSSPQVHASPQLLHSHQRGRACFCSNGNPSEPFFSKSSRELSVRAHSHGSLWHGCIQWALTNMVLHDMAAPTLISCFSPLLSVRTLFFLSLRNEAQGLCTSVTCQNEFLPAILTDGPLLPSSLYSKHIFSKPFLANHFKWLKLKWTFQVNPHPTMYFLSS